MLKMRLFSLLKLNSGAKKIIFNISWLFFDKILKMLFGVFVISMISRYLGPTQYGLLNYITALISLFIAFSALGLNGIVVRDLLIKEKEAPIILGTAFGLKLIGGIISFFFFLLLVYTLRPDDNVTISLSLVLGFMLIFKSADVIKFWYESQTASKYTVIVENSAFLIVGTVKLALIYFEASLKMFVLAILLESILVFIFFFLIYKKNKSSFFNWKFKRDKAKNLLRDSWPLIISSSAWIIYSKIDQVMIGQMMDDTAVGYYSAATRISDMVSFIPAMVAFSIIPSILKYRKKNNKLYMYKFQNIYNIVTSILFLLAIFITFFSEHIINFVFGAQYSQSANVLKIHFWTVILIGLAVVSGRYLINEGLQRITMYRHLTGVLINIPLNFILIPKIGIDGAAVSSLISLFCANYLLDYFNRDTKIIFKQKTKALFFTWGLNQLKNKKHEE